MDISLPQAGRARQAELAWTIPPLGKTEDLLTCDDDGQEHATHWLKCPCFTDAEVSDCLLQRKGQSAVLVVDLATTMRLVVQLFVCRSHNKYFAMTHPAVFSQLKARGARITPGIVVLSRQSIITEGAYECALDLHQTVCLIVEKPRMVWVSMPSLLSPLAATSF